MRHGSIEYKDGSIDLVSAHQGRNHSIDTIEAVPVLLMEGHEWKLFYFWNRRTHFSIVGSYLWGYTSSLLGMYAILSSLKLLVEWVDIDLLVLGIIYAT